MSINGIDRTSYINNVYKLNANKATNKVEEVKNTDTIEISSLGKTLNEYSNDSTVDNTKKIADIRSQIANGTYNVDAKLTAQSILDNIKEE